jgi:hypothetical protein
MATSSKLIDLRQLLSERFPQTFTPATDRLATSVPAIDKTIGGGLPKNAITELTSPNVSAGSALLIYALLQNAHRAGYFLALVDGQDSFNPQPLHHALLCHLLWVRCRKTSEALQAVDLLLRDGNFPLVILDLVLNAPEELRKIPQSNWYRLQRLVEVAPAACLVLTRTSIISSAQLKLSLDNTWRIGDLEQDCLSDRLKILVKRAQGAGQQITAAAS